MTTQERLFTENKIRSILEHYDCSHKSCEFLKLGNGLINQTYKVIDDTQSFVLQKINQLVFTKPEQVIENANKINEFLTQQKQQNSYSLKLIPHLQTKSKQYFVHFQDPKANVIETWRALKLIAQTKTIEVVETPAQAEKVATAFGQFSYALSSFNTKLLDIVIPDFHNLEFRLNQLETAISQSKVQTSSQIQVRVDELINYCRQQKNFALEVKELQANLPFRVTHNDTKINNLLFDSNAINPVAVIDLDTCMPGFLMNDFGDMVRTCCSTLAEDAVEINKMQLRMDIFEALAKGYQDAFNGQLSVMEQESLVVGAQLLPFICGIRFLTDYLNGNVYFNTAYEQHNLDRAANQLHFYKLLSESKEKLKSLVVT